MLKEILKEYHPRFEQRRVALAAARLPDASLGEESCDRTLDPRPEFIQFSHKSLALDSYNSAGLARLRTSTAGVVRLDAARAVWRITGELGDLLDVLASVGPDAVDLAPHLLPRLDNSDGDVAVRAAVAYWQLTRDAEPVVPVLTRHLSCGRRGVIAASCLAGIGPAVAAALPLLRAAIDTDVRPHPWADSVVGEDEWWVDACTEAVARVSA